MTKFLILKQAKKLVMRMSTRKLILGKRNIVDSRVTEARSAAGMLQKDLLARFQIAGVEISPLPSRFLKDRNARYLTSSSRCWPKF